MGLLTGVRVLAVEQYGAGPFGTQALADLGADVIKIENPGEGGDVTRSLGPYFDDSLDETSQSLFFQALNRNKRSVALDLASPEGYAVFRKLARHADAVASNLRGDVPARLGLTYDRLADLKPSLVCCHLSAYGRGGSREKWPGYDYLIQAETGYFSLNGEPDSAPSRFGLSVVDFMTGYCMALALVSGVLNARQSGKGRDIDVSLYDVGIANLNYMAAWTLNRDFAPSRLSRSAHPTLGPCQLFKTADGWIYIMANKEKFFPKLCERLECPELAVDLRFRTFSDRQSNRQILSDILDSVFVRHGTAQWLERLAGAVPAAAVANMAAALASDFTAERGMIMRLEAENGASLSVIGSPFVTGEAIPQRAAPVLGRHTDALLAEAGLDADEIDDLRSRGILR